LNHRSAAHVRQWGTFARSAPRRLRWAAATLGSP
jgi:hypothetical protein